MDNITIEFFHDVICSFCFPMSYNMRELSKQYPNIKIVHRSFALVWEKSYFDVMFGSHEQAKTEIITHWGQANQMDTLQRFNIKGMEEKEFLFPSSTVALIAAKAAYVVGGDALYWNAFDALQEALFVKNLDVSDKDVVNSVINSLDIDYYGWEQAFNDPETKSLVEADLELASQYGISSVPTLIINGKYQLNGTASLSQLVAALHQISSQ